jgi:DNA-binding SARP family transcriptional activator
MTMRIYLAGRVAIEIDGQVVIDQREFRGRQGRLLFAYLVAERTHPVSRQELASVIWGDTRAGSWENALSALLSRTSRALSDVENQGYEISITRRVGQYHLQLPAGAWIDLEAATSAVDRAEVAISAGRFNTINGPATVAVSIARRPFLSGVTGAWAEAQRARLNRILLRGLDCLSEMWLELGEPQYAVETASEATGLALYRERSHRLLMRAHADDGEPATALDVYHRLSNRLNQDLATGPSSETEALYVQMLR